MQTKFLITITHKTPIADLADKIAGRSYTLDGVENAEAVAVDDVQPTLEHVLLDTALLVNDRPELKATFLEMWGAQQSQTPTGLTEQFIDDFLLTYEMEGEDDQGRDCSYSPTEAERALIKDASLGMLAEVESQSPEKEQLGAVASQLMTAWCNSHGMQIPWAKAVEIAAIVTKMPDEEKQRLLKLK